MSVEITTKSKEEEKKLGPKPESYVSSEKSEKLRQKIEELRKRWGTEEIIIQEKIAKVKEKIEKGFNSEKEIKIIRKLPHNKRREALNIFKEKVNSQLEGLAEVQESITKEIYKNPDASANDLMNLITTQGALFGINENQRQLAKETIDAYVKKHKSVKDFLDLKLSAKEMYKRIFGAKPRGRIEVVPGPISLYFRCQNSDDFALIHSQKFEDSQEPSIIEKEEASNTHGVTINGSLIPELRGTIIAENSGPIGYWTTILSDFEENNVGKFKTSRSTRMHEEQHTLRSLFVDILIGEDGLVRLANAKTREQKDAAITNVMRYGRQSAEAEAADEILAYLKGQTKVSEIKKRLLHEYSTYRKPIIKEKYKAMYLLGTRFPNENKKGFIGIAHEVFGKEYDDLITNSLSSIEKLKSAGYSTDKIIALLTHEPLQRWSKVVDRLQ